MKYSKWNFEKTKSIITNNYNNNLLLDFLLIEEKVRNLHILVSKEYIKILNNIDKDIIDSKKTLWDKSLEN